MSCLIHVIERGGAVGASETWVRVLDSPNPGDVTFNGSGGSQLIVPSSTVLLPGDADSGMVVTEGGGANGGDLVSLQVDGLVVFSGEVLAGGLTKVTTGDILDPMIMRITPKTTAELTAAIPYAAEHDMALDSDLGYIVRYNGAAWERFTPVATNTVVNDTLTSTSTAEALSANQGKVLKDALDAQNEVIGTAIPPKSDDAVGAIGTDNDEYAAGDHKHPAQGVSSDTDNPIKVGTDGLHDVRSVDLIGLATNQVLVSTVDNGLAVEAYTGPPPVADDIFGATGTSLRVARGDHKHAVQPVSTDAEQLLKLGSDDYHMLDPDDLISTDTPNGFPNGISKGTDGKLVASATVIDDLVTGGVSVALSAEQGKVLTAKDVASGAVTGTNIVLTFNDATTMSIDATALVNDLHVQSGTYNSGTTSIDFVVSDGQPVPVLTTVSVLVSDLLASVTDATIDGDGTTASPLGLADDAVTTIKILDDAVTTAKILDNAVITAKILDDAITTLKILDANITKAKLAADVYATAISPASDDATGAIGTSDELARADHKHIAQSVSATAENMLSDDATDGLAFAKADNFISVDADNMLIKGSDGLLTASLAASDVGVPGAGDFVMGWSNGSLTIFPK